MTLLVSVVERLRRPGPGLPQGGDLWGAAGAPLSALTRARRQAAAERMGAYNAKTRTRRLTARGRALCRHPVYIAAQLELGGDVGADFRGTWRCGAKPMGGLSSRGV